MSQFALCVQTLSTSIIIGCILAAAGFLCFLFSVFKNSAPVQKENGTVFQWIGVILVSLFTLGPILADPISVWDARSIWFFHAKMIYYANSMGLPAGWQHSAAAFSQVDYPNLVPALAAQIASIMGFWNEYLPKMALFYVWLPAILSLFSFSKRSFSFVFLVLLIPFSFYPWIWNGYMDGLLAVYFSISMLLLGRFIQTSQSVDLISSLACLFLVMNLKNEGALAALAGGCAILVIVMIRRKNWRMKQAFNLKNIIAGLLAALPFVLWTIYKNQWGLSNELGIGSSESFARIISRLGDSSDKHILVAILKQLDAPLMILALLVLFMILWKKHFRSHFLPVIITFLIYSTGIFTVYLLTPFDLEYHLFTSIERTMLPANGLLIILCYFILESLEKSIFNQENKVEIQEK